MHLEKGDNVMAVTDLKLAQEKKRKCFLNRILDELRILFI